MTDSAPSKNESADWTMLVRVRLQNALMHSEGEKVMRETIADEGGLMAVIGGWCDEDDLELISLEPLAPSNSQSIVERLLAQAPDNMAIQDAAAEIERLRRALSAKDTELVDAVMAQERLTRELADHEEVHEDKRRICREIERSLYGEQGARS